MQRDRLMAAGVGLLMASVLAGSAAQAQQQPAQQQAPPQQQQPSQQSPDRTADSDRLHIFIVSAAIGVSDGGGGGGRGRGATSRPCEITSVVRAFCSAPGGISRDGCEITDGQI